jgi:hypothetical protein
MKTFLIAVFWLCLSSSSLWAWASTDYTQGAASTTTYYQRYPYFVIQYENPEYVTVQSGGSFETDVATDTGAVHHLRYANGWWYDYNTGIGFPAQVSQDTSAN